MHATLRKAVPPAREYSVRVPYLSQTHIPVVSRKSHAGHVTSSLWDKHSTGSANGTVRVKSQTQISKSLVTKLQVRQVSVLSIGDVGLARIRTLMGPTMDLGPQSGPLASRRDVEKHHWGGLPLMSAVVPGHAPESKNVCLPWHAFLCLLS